MQPLTLKMDKRLCRSAKSTVQWKNPERGLYMNPNKDRHKGLLPFLFYHDFIFSRDRSCTSCLNFRFKHSADSNACKRKLKKKREKAEVITTRNIYKGQTIYRRYQALNMSSSEWIQSTVAFLIMHTQLKEMFLFVGLEIDTIQIGKMQHDGKKNENKNSSFNSLYCN